MVLMTDHCKVRVQQRGIKKSAVNAIFSHGDLVVHAKYGRLKIGISKRRIAKLIEDGVIDAKMSEKLQGRWIIANSENDNNEVVTAYVGKDVRQKDWRRKRGGRDKW